MSTKTTTRTRSGRLQKKLHELEAELAEVIRLTPADPTETADESHRETPLAGVEQRFAFLENLLSAEVASQSAGDDRLHEIGRRLTALKGSFRDWKEGKSSRSFDYNHDDSLSICSDCTQALLCDGVEKFSGEELTEKDENEAAPAAEEMIWAKMVKLCGVFGCGFIVGAFCVVKLFSHSADYLFQCEGFLVPPT